MKKPENSTSKIFKPEPSKIHIEIEKLQSKLKKIEFLNLILIQAKENRDVKFEDIRFEVLDFLKAFVKEKVLEIENDITPRETLSNQDFRVLCNLAKRVTLQASKPPNIQSMDNLFGDLPNDQAK